MMKKTHICLVGILLASTGWTFARDYSLVKDHAAVSIIVLADNAGPVERHAAAELATYLRKASGAKVEIQSTPSKNLYNVHIGTVESQGIPLSDSMKAALPRIAPQGFMLAADKGGLRIIGRQPVGVLYGAYAILKKYADVRWFAPGVDYEYCPKKPTIAVPEQLTVSNPSFKLRYSEFVCANVDSRTVDTWDWMVRNGLTIRIGKHLYDRYRDEWDKRGTEIYYGGHVFSYLLSDSLFDEHPEYFPLIDGKRIKQEQKGLWPQPCTSNPKVAEIMAESLDKYLDLPPKGGGFLIGNNDDTHWCQCEDCARLDPPEEKRKGFVGTRYYTLINQIAAQVYKTHPHADLWSWAYQNYQYPPTGIVPDKRLSVQVCVHHRCYRHSMADEKCLANAKFREVLAGWMKFGNPIITREYDECFPGEPPYIPAERIFCQDIKYYHKLGLSGFTLVVAPPDGVFGPAWNTRRTKEAWVATWQMRYLAAQLAWDVNADYGRLVEDMGSKYYGPAWPAMKQYREQLIRMYEETPGDICYGTPDYLLGKCLEKPGVETHLLQLLDESEKTAANDPAVIKKIRRDREYFGMCWQSLHREYLTKRPKEVCAGKRTGKITVDGKFDEEDWKKVDFATNFIVNDGKTIADPQSFVKILYDADNLYFAVEAMEPQSAKLQAACSTRDGPRMWGDSTVEFFIAIPGMNGQYYQIAVNPRGTIYDALNSPSQAADLAFDARAEVKTTILPDRWTAEARIPAASLGRKIRDGETWRINVGRSRKLTDGTVHQASSWSNGVFHGPEAYRPVVFGDTALLKNGDFEESREPNQYERAYFDKTSWRIDGGRVPEQWTFNGDHGTAALLDKGAASGKQFLRLSGAIYARINQPADYRDDLLIRAKVRGKGHLAIYLYRYHRATDKNEPSVILKEAEVASGQWTPVEANYKCLDDRILRLAFHVTGEIDIDDVQVTQEKHVGVAPLPQEEK